MDYDILARAAEKDPSCLIPLISGGIISTEDMKTIRSIMKDNEYKLLKTEVLEIHPGTIHRPTKGNPRWWTYVADKAYAGGRRRLTAKTENDLYRIIADFYHHYKHSAATANDRKTAGEPDTYTIRSLYPKWLEHKALRTDAETYISRIESTWKRNYEGTRIINYDIRDLTKLQLEDWAYAILREMGRDKRKYYSATMIMRQVLEYAVDLEILDSNPFSKVKIDSRHDFKATIKPEPETQVFILEEKAMLIQHAWDDFRHNHKLRFPLASLAVALQLNTGLRVGELCAVRFQDIKGNVLKVTHFVRLQDQLIDGAKTPAGVREIPLPPESVELIEFCREWQKDHFKKVGPFVFSGEEPLKPRIMTDRYDSFCKALGIRKRSSHKARKTYVSTLIDAGINIDTVRKTAGHSSTQVTLQNYTFDRLEKEKRNQSIINAVTDRKPPVAAESV